MNSQTNQTLPRALKYLPGIYQELGSIPDSPLWALVTIIDGFFNQVEKTLESLPDIFDPDITPVAEDPDKDFLSWLAQWVLLPVDRDLLSGDGMAVAGDEVGSRERHWRRLMKDAALLYRLRGTSLGLRYMVEAFYDLEIEIIERAWPQGMIIGKASTIETQTFIIDPQDMARSFILAIKLSNEAYSTIKASGSWLEVPYTGEDLEDSGKLLVCADGNTDSLEAAPLLKKLRKIKQLVEQEKPLHTQCFIAFQTDTIPVVKDPIWPNLVIGIQSIIEAFVINGE